MLKRGCVIADPECMDDLASTARTPAPVDPTAAPRILLRGAGVVVLAGLAVLFLGVAVAARSEGPPFVSPQVFLGAWLASLPLGGLLLVAHAGVGRRRLRRYERRFGFLPKAGRKGLPKTGRTTLVRLEYGSRGDQVCLMLTRWDYLGTEGWRRGRILDLCWAPSDDAVALGEQRARVTAKGELLEEGFDDARLAGDGYREITDELSAEQRAAADDAHRLAETLARDNAR